MPPTENTEYTDDDNDDRRSVKRTAQNAFTALCVLVRCEEVSLQR